MHGNAPLLGHVQRGRNHGLTQMNTDFEGEMLSFASTHVNRSYDYLILSDPCVSVLIRGK